MSTAPTFARNISARTRARRRGLVGPSAPCMLRACSCCRRRVFFCHRRWPFSAWHGAPHPTFHRRLSRTRSKKTQQSAGLPAAGRREQPRIPMGQGRKWSHIPHNCPHFVPRPFRDPYLVRVSAQKSSCGVTVEGACLVQGYRRLNEWFQHGKNGAKLGKNVAKWGLVG